MEQVCWLTFTLAKSYLGLQYSDLVSDIPKKSKQVHMSTVILTKALEAGRVGGRKGEGNEGIMDCRHVSYRDNLFRTD